MKSNTKPSVIETITLDRLVGGGQTIGQLATGKKVFVWGGLPGEMVEIRLTKQKASYAEAVVSKVLQPSAQRIEPVDGDSYLSTSPWQIMDFQAEQRAKAQLIVEAFEMHHSNLDNPKATVWSDDVQFGYRNKVEFSWWWSNHDGQDQLDLAFFIRGGQGKRPVQSTSLARAEINKLAVAIRDLLRGKPIGARNLKTLLIRCDQSGNCVWQLYVKDHLSKLISDIEATALPAQGGEIIYSDPRSPASRITERLASFGNVVLMDQVLGVPFSYATEGFFQVNLPVYQKALQDMKVWIADDAAVVDLYSGVGSIGLTIGGNDLTLVEIDKHAYRELVSNLAAQGRSKHVQPVLAATEKALEHITGQATIIVDPPRAGLHQAVVERLLEVMPSRIVYLSCNPVTQARDVSLLAPVYRVAYHQGYNFFPRTPHIEHLVVLDRID